MNKRTDIDLKGVPQTLLLPLIGRAKLSEEIYSPLHDAKAIELVNSIDYDFNSLLNVKNVKQSALFWMARAVHFDAAIKAYLKNNPTAVIVNLGAGLDTAFNRVNNGQLTWVDLDLPEVISLREKLLPPTSNEHYIAKSVLDFSWMEDVKKYGDDVFFFAGGLFMYFTEAQIKSILITIATHFPGAQMIFDNIFPKGLKRANCMLEKSGMKDALLKWGIYNAKDMEAWSSSIKLVSQTPYFKDIKSNYRFPLSSKITMYFFDYVHKSGIIQLRLGIRSEL